ncbi:MAG: amino acid permease [Desulfuromonas sp.]|nr:MAG: amino acid permease [Desulfuromonas sp.]
MGAAGKQKRLSKELKLLDVYAIATGATLSAGFFLLPGIAAAQAGPALVLAYLLAAIPLIPAMFSIIELATAMPRAGGVYYFLDRSLGPYLGTIGGIGTWLALILKVAFALIGMGAYIALFLPELEIVPVALTIAVVLALVNMFGTSKGGHLQVFLVFLLLGILSIFFAGSAPQLQPRYFNDFFAAGFDAIVSTAGLVYISYVGVTKVASLSEEVRNPEHNLPRGVILALTSSILIYGFGTAVIVGLVPPEQLQGSLTPVADAARIAFGDWGVYLLSLAALAAFVSVANAGIMSASRYPLAMSRDHLLPAMFRKLSRHGTPLNGILVTLLSIVLIILLFDPLRIAKLASAFQLLMFALVCLAVIVMRESQIESYDPGYRSPFYPWMQIVGILAPLYLIFEMGPVPTLFSLGLIAVSTVWYVRYARQRVSRAGGIYHVFERLGRHKHHDLDTELRGILREKGLRDEDPFDEIVARSLVFDVDQETSFDELLQLVAFKLRSVIPLTVEEIIEQVMEGTRIGATPVTRGVALPHFRTDRIEQAEMVLVRACRGVRMMTYNPLTLEEDQEVELNAVFFLVSPDSNPTQHLRILARIAERVDEESFVVEWDSATTEQELRASLLQDERFLTLSLRRNRPAEQLIGLALRDAGLPPGCLVALLSREGRSFVPNGNTVLADGDQLTVIGEKQGLSTLKARFRGNRRTAR